MTTMNLNWSDIVTQIVSKLPDVFLLFIGAVLAVIGGFISDWHRERREKNANKEAFKAACRFVSLEFAHNQQSLSDFWKEVQENSRHGVTGQIK